MARYEVGKYECEITGQGFQKASTGNMQLVLQFNILGKIDPHNANAVIEVIPGERKLYKTITDKTVEWVMEDLKTLGVESLSSWAQLDPQTEGFIDLAGTKVDMTCGSKNGTDGKSYEDWSIARSGSGGKPIEHAGSKDVAALDRLFGKQLKKGAAPAGRSRSTAGREPQSISSGQVGTLETSGLITDDDVPF